MYAIIRELKVVSGFKDENLRRVNEQLLPRLREVPGFIDYYLVYAEHDEEYAVAVFADKKGAGAYQKIVGELVRDAGPNLKLQATAQGPVVAQSAVSAVSAV